MKKLNGLNIKNKTVLLRADLDISEGGDLRLEAGIPTIKCLLENNCRIVIIGHLGRPKGKLDTRFGLMPVFEKLKKYFPDKNLESFKFASDITGDKTQEIVENMRAGDILMFENLRFWKQEESNSENFAKHLASLAGVFINDAFAVCHRKHASIIGIPKFLPSYMGLRLEKEIEVLSCVMQDPQHPAVAIIGGAKVETKLPVISEMAKSYDTVLVGGKLMLESSKFPPNWRASKVQSSKLSNVITPVDYIGENKFDIGEQTIKQYKEIISKAKTIVWNGPMGKFEDEEFIHGTKEIAYAIIESGAYSIVGGGDTIAAINKLKIPFDKFGWISTGGGAMLEFMSGKKLAGVEVLDTNFCHPESCEAGEGSLQQYIS